MYSLLKISLAFLNSFTCTKKQFVHKNNLRGYVISSQFNHANIKLPKKIDLWISYLLVSPDMHKTHHHFRLPHTDKNYGNIHCDVCML